MTTQFWPTVADTSPADMQSVRAVPRHVEIGFEPWQVAQTRQPRHGGADVIVGHEIEMPAGLSHVLEQ